MDIIPAIDLHNGRCVRLLQGERNKETVYSDAPGEMALKWQSQGASRLHLVDLDGAFEGKPVNSSVIEEIVSSVDIPVQLGGGMRDKNTIENALKTGVSNVILGTAAVRDPELVQELVENYGEQIIVGIDAREGIVSIEGWVKGSGKRAVDFALQMQDYGVSRIIYTDITRDGTMEGPNINALEHLASHLDIPVIASGGVSSLEDLRRLKRLMEYGVTGVIIGQALYSGRLTLKDAIIVTRENNEEKSF